MKNFLKQSSTWRWLGIGTAVVSVLYCVAVLCFDWNVDTTVIGPVLVTIFGEVYRWRVEC
jgi:hypothetical protein